MAGIDTSIYSQFLRPVRSVADFDAEARKSQLDELMLADAREGAVGKQRARQRQDQLQQLMRGLPAGASDDDRIAALRGGAFFGEADALADSIGKRAKATADVEATRTKTKGDAYDLQRKQFEHRVGGLQQFTQPEDARQWLADSVTTGAMSMKDAQQMMRTVPQDVAAFGDWKTQTLMQLVEAGKQLGFKMPDANARLSASTADANRVATTQRADADRASREREGAAGRAVQREGIKAAGERAKVAADAATKRGAGKGSMSATLQKELIDADDLAAQSEQAAKTLEKALELNTKAYSGYGAKARAQVRSNLPGKSGAADATIELDNLIGEQALSGMKAIFGGNPTEGERAILLDLQASADKTPKQREAIIQRGIAAARRRAALNAERAKSIRSGTYLTDGADPVDDGGGFRLIGTED